MFHSLRRNWQVLSSTELGGGELVALKLSQSLNRLGIESGVLSAGNGPAQEYAQEHLIHFDNFPLEQCSSNSLLLSIIGNVRFILKLANKKNDLLHFHSPFSYRFVAKSLKLFKTAPTIVHIHLEYEKNGLTWALQYPPDIIIVCAEFLEAYVRDCLPENVKATQRIVVLSNAVDLEKFYPAPDLDIAKNNLNIPATLPIILMVADIAPHKGQTTLVKAVNLLKLEGIECQCWLVGKARSGSGLYEQELHEMVTTYGLEDHVIFKGHRFDIPELMRAADCLVLPSTKEGLPLCILEAQASGLPVVAAPTSGIPEVIKDGETGFLVEANDAAGYANRLKELLLDEQLNKKISSNAYDACKSQRSWEMYVKRTAKIYETLY